MGDKIKECTTGSTCRIHGKMRNVYKSLVGILERKRPPMRFSRKLENCIKADIRGKDCGLA
jgi:hypothetical protein